MQGGTITLNAGGAITAAGDIVSDGNGTEASGGVIMLTSAAGDVIVSGSLSSNGGSDAGGGFISVVAQGGKIDIAQPVDLSGGEFDGGELDLTASGDVIVRQEINVSGGGLSGSGGTVFITAGGSATLLGNIDGTAAGSSDEGGGDGADVEIDANQDVVVNGPIDVTSGFPDGKRRDVLLDGGRQLHADAEDHALRQRHRRLRRRDGRQCGPQHHPRADRGRRRIVRRR